MFKSILFNFQIPDHLRSDEDATVYTLDVEGNVYGKLFGSLFQHKSTISLKRPNVRVLLQTEQLTYKQQQTGWQIQLIAHSWTTFVEDC